MSFHATRLAWGAFNAKPKFLHRWNMFHTAPQLMKFVKRAWAELRRHYTKNLGCLLDGDQLAFGDLAVRRLEAIHFVVASQIADMPCRESLARCRFPSLPIENASDDIIRV